MTKIIWMTMSGLLMILSLTYIFFAFKRALSACNLSRLKCRLYAFLGTAVFAGMIFLPGRLGRSWMVILLHLCVLLLITQLIDYFLKRIGRKTWPLWNVLYQYSIFPIVITSVLMLYGYFNIANIVRTEYTVHTDKDIPPSGYTVVLIADTHFENATTLPMIEQLMAKVRTEKPDLVLLGGDIVDENTSNAGMKSIFPILGSANPTHGTYYVFGNHDRALYAEHPPFTVAELEEAIQSSHITILADQTVQVSDTFFLAGRRDRTMGQLPVKDLLVEADPEDYILVLDHQPYDFRIKQEAGADMTLSGHTHAGQIFPAGMFTAGDLNYGRVVLDTLTAIVTSGASGWGFPIRTSKHSEYVVIHILPQ